MIDIALVEDIEVRAPADSAKMDDELVCNSCDGVICDVEHGDSLGLLVRIAANHLMTCGQELTTALTPGDCLDCYGGDDVCHACPADPAKIEG